MEKANSCVSLGVNLIELLDFRISLIQRVESGLCWTCVDEGNCSAKSLSKEEFALTSALVIVNSFLNFPK